MLHSAISLLGRLVATPSFPGEEAEAANLLEAWFQSRGVQPNRMLNNVWASAPVIDTSKPTLLLNSHLDTVRPNAGYTLDPHKAILEADRLHGLGTTDAGASLCCLAELYCQLYEEDLPYNLVFLASAEEEISGRNGIEAIFPFLPPITMAIVGEPTSMRMAIAQKGLMVLDCQNKGEAGHAARLTGKNALYMAVDDITAVRNLVWERESEMQGRVQCQATMIRAGIAHNQIPDLCDWVVDVRTTSKYSTDEILTKVRSVVQAEVEPRSTRLQARSTPDDHILAIAGKACGMELYGSDTLSDWALIPCPAVKIGPGDTMRSHTADEYVLISEVEEGITGYAALLAAIASEVKKS